ncbi:DUF4810 domain-containing protein [Flavobacterium sp.]|uniref:DUF4810 domain-containing protein n=1 Tax=Flavobacterium sp. TaxID=239 RepID=UPI003751FA15
MRKLILTSIAALVLASCSAPTKLYTWSKYETSSYNFLKNRNDKTNANLEEEYKKIINKQKGIRGVVPPGVYADYGFLLLQSNKIEEGRSMLQKEMDLYPESKIFMDRILKMTEL